MTIAEIILQHYNDELIRRKLKPADSEPYIVDPTKFIDCMTETKEMLRFHLKNNGLYSSLLLHKLTRHRCQVGEIFGDSLEYYNSSEICHLIEKIELNKIKQKPFKNNPLKNLYKIHHGASSGLGYSLILNIKNYWFDKEGQIKKKNRKSYENIISTIDNERISLIASKMHDVAVFSKKLTGEWLIYAEHENKKYYLCLATHDEGDQNIFNNKILDCYKEFPEIGINYNFLNNKYAS